VHRAPPAFLLRQPEIFPIFYPFFLLRVIGICEFKAALKNQCS